MHMLKTAVSRLPCHPKPDWCEQGITQIGKSCRSKAYQSVTKNQSRRRHSQRMRVRKPIHHTAINKRNTQCGQFAPKHDHKNQHNAPTQGTIFLWPQIWQQTRKGYGNRLFERPGSRATWWHNPHVPCWAHFATPPHLATAFATPDNNFRHARHSSTGSCFHVF